MKRLKTELNALVNRGVDRHLRLAVTGLSRSGKTAFITALVNQLLNIHTGARLPLLSAAREERLLGVKRVPQRDFGIPRFTYDEGLAQLYGQPPMWPTPTRGVSEIRLALRYRSNDSLLRHFKDTSTLYLEIVDYPGEWLLDLPMQMCIRDRPGADRLPLQSLAGPCRAGAQLKGGKGGKPAEPGVGLRLIQLGLRQI